MFSVIFSLTKWFLNQLTNFACNHFRLHGNPVASSLNILEVHGRMKDRRRKGWTLILGQNFNSDCGRQCFAEKCFLVLQGPNQAVKWILEVVEAKNFGRLAHHHFYFLVLYT